jgi:hypothetical protein
LKTQAGNKLLILLPQPFECWHYRLRESFKDNNVCINSWINKCGTITTTTEKRGVKILHRIRTLYGQVHDPVDCLAIRDVCGRRDHQSDKQIPEKSVSSGILVWGTNLHGLIIH